MDMILNGEMCTKVNHKMIGIGRIFWGRISDFWAWSVVLCMLWVCRWWTFCL